MDAKSQNDDNSDSSTFILKIPKQKINVLLQQFSDTNNVCLQEVSPKLFSREDHAVKKSSEPCQPILSPGNDYFNSEQATPTVEVASPLPQSHYTNPFLMPPDTRASEDFLNKVIENTSSYMRKNTNPFLVSEEDCAGVYSDCSNYTNPTGVEMFKFKSDSNSELSSPLNSPSYDEEMNNSFLSASDSNVSKQKVVQLQEILPKVDIKNQDFLLSDSYSSISNLTDHFLKLSMVDNEWEIEQYFDKASFKVGDFMKVRISNIYNPSKFWVVPKYKELEVFMEYLLEFYTKYRREYKLQTVCTNLYCVISNRGLYFRAIIVSFLPNSPKQIKTFLLDYGIILIANTDDVYSLSEKMYQVPQFAIRASLAFVRPRQSPIWTTKVVSRFDELTNEKVLIAQIVHINKEHKTLELNIGELEKDRPVLWYINKTLINEGHAKYIFEKKSEADPNSKFVSKVEYLYLFPSFEMIEIGNVPSSVYQNEVLQYGVQIDTLFKQYYRYKS